MLFVQAAAEQSGTALNRFLEDTERWAAEVLESHLSYPVLSFYRSQHDNQSWLAALTCILDAAALSLTVTAGSDRQQARLTFATARHAVVDIALVLRSIARAPLHGSTRRRARPTELMASFKSAGWEVRDDDSAIAKLAELRGLYEPFAEALSRYLGDWTCRRSGPIAADRQLAVVSCRHEAGRRPGPLLAADPRDEHF